MKNAALLVGYARVDITPQSSVPLAGYGNTSMRMSRTIRDELYASCFAITDREENTILLMSIDLSRITAKEAEDVRAAAQQRFGIPADHVFIAGTHTHSAPDLHNHNHPAIQQYSKLLEERLPACVDLAMADRCPARMFVGDVEAAGMTMTYTEQQQTHNHESWFPPFLFEGDIILKHLKITITEKTIYGGGSNFPTV